MMREQNMIEANATKPKEFIMIYIFVIYQLLLLLSSIYTG